MRALHYRTTKLFLKLAFTSLALALCLLPTFAPAAGPAPPTTVPEEQGSADDPSQIQERAVPGVPARPIVSPGVIVASLEKDLNLLEQETRSAQARLAQPGSNAQALASASFPKLDALTRSIAGKAATLQQLYSQANDQRRLGAATSIKASADQMTQMVTALTTQPRAVSEADRTNMMQLLSNVLRMLEDTNRAIISNIR